MTDEPTSTFLRACRGLPVDHTPIWLMRQAGRYMSEYRAIRAEHSMLEVIRTPELAAEVTLQPMKAFDLDAAIIFADILPPLIGMGLDLDFVKGEGPVIENPLSTTLDIDRLATPPAEAHLGSTLRAIEIVKQELDRPLIGFAGAPFTLASYAIEGGGSKNYTKTKALMVSEPAAWKRLMEKLVTVQADYLLAQARAGADALQVFDSWVGQALGQQQYLRYVQPYNKGLFEKLAKAGVPVINFSTGTSAYLRDVADCGGDVIGVDWRLPLDRCRAQVGERPLQGNLDPAYLLAPWRELRHQAEQVLLHAEGKPHVFNLGHGIFPQTPVDNVRRLVDFVHERSRRGAAGEGFVASAGIAGEDADAGEPPLGVLVMAYGGPNHLDELPGYLSDIRTGRPTTPEVLEEISHNYSSIGGKSPLLEFTERQVEAIAAHFDPRRYRFYLGMRHWGPWIEEVVGQMIDDGIRNAVSLVLAPHYSTMSVRKYQKKIADGLDMYRGQIDFSHVSSYHDAPGLIDALARRVREGLERFDEAERDRVHVVFSAHSLPVRILKEGDPYDQQLRETARLVAAAVDLPDERWSWSYQSAGRSPEPWLGPQLEEHLPTLAERGIDKVVSIPVGFVSDHVEILYDIDIEAQKVAEEHGMRLERPPALNDDPVFIAQLAELIRSEAERRFPEHAGETAEVASAGEDR